VSLPKLAEIVRKNCPSAAWSQGVKLARGGGVAVESRDPEEIVLRVRTPGRPVAPTVVLYPGEREWDCDCGGRLRVCEHVAAGVIALTQAVPDDAAAEGTEGDAGAVAAQALPSVSQSWGRVVYRFTKVEGGLQLRRAIVRGDGGETPIATTLSAILARPAEAATVQPEEADLQADLLLGSGARGTLPPSKLDALLKVLVGARNVYLDGRAVAIAEEEVRPRASIEDRGEDVAVVIDRDPRVTDVLSAGVALCGDAIHRLGEVELTGGWLQHVPIVQTAGPRQLGELTTKTLPELSKRMTVDVRSRRLPKVTRDLAPRVVIELNQVGDSLSVLPTLVYGVPPCARIDDGRLVYLKGPVPVRDEAAERRLVERLRESLSLLPGRRASFQGPDAGRFAEKLKAWRGDLTGDAAHLVGAQQVRLVPRMQVEALPGLATGAPQVRVELGFVVEAEPGRPAPTAGRTVDAAAVVRAWQDGLGLVPLDGGGWAPLPMDWLRQHGQRLADLLAARAADGRVANHALPALGALCQELECPPPPGLDRLATLAAGFDRLPAAPLPGDLTATLRPYQQRGVDWIAFLREAGLGGVLADDMGLGKTLQALCTFTGKTLVVCPTSVLYNWRAELARFRPGLKACLYHGPGRTLDEGADVVVTSYALLRLDASRLGARRWAMVVLDEAQAIKNPDSQVARAAYGLEADFRLALTGTPIENRLEELWSLMHFTNRGLLGGRGDFDDRYAAPIADGVGGAARALRERVRPFVLRRLKRDVAPELPPRSEAVLHVELDERERGVYEAVRAATRADVVELLDGGGSVMKALEALLRLRQAACHPTLVPGQAKAPSSSKLDALVGALETALADGHKALVFSQWTSLLDLIEGPLGRAQIPFCRLDGSTRDRAAVVERFQAEDGPPVMLISLKAGGTGLNLTAADHVFLCDPWWNPAVEDQAADRAHRIGQQRPVFVHRLVSLGTVEERILTLQDSKRRLVEAALGDGGAAAGLTREDLMALLS
jgi:superfamily II DNA or RNA helicase